MKTKYGKLEKAIRADFTGGWNAYVGIRQVKDNESPNITNCDFMGKGGVGNRQGYTEIGSADATNNDGVVGMCELHTATLHQLMRFCKNAAVDVKMEYSTGGAWTQVADTFAPSLNIDTCQAMDKIYTGNGSDIMHHWDGAAWAHTTNGTVGYYPSYYNNRIWVKDETYPDRLNFSGQSVGGADGGAAADKLGDFSDATAGYIRIKPGSGAEIMGLRVFKNALYVFLRNAIYSLSPATAADTFTVTLITNSVGAVSHRAIVQTEEDLMFAADDGVYSLGEVANYTSVRTTNKSAKLVEVFNNLDGASLNKLSAKYYNFKYHLFYSSNNTNNDAAIIYDVRYKGWLKWTNIPASIAYIYEDSTADTTLVFGHPTNSEVYTMYEGNTDAGTPITSTFYTKSFDDDMPDTQKVYFDHTFVFGILNGQVSVSVIFNDTHTTSTKSLTQVSPTGGFGRDAFGVVSFGGGTNTATTTTSYQGYPIRMRVSGKKFAVQYKITSSGSWRLDSITTTYKPLSHYAFPSRYKV